MVGLNPASPRLTALRIVVFPCLTAALGACAVQLPPLEDARPGVWPLGGYEAPPELADPYGPRLLGGEYDFHRGIDLRAERGTPVYAVADGRVVRRDFPPPGSDDERLGRVVVLVHEDDDGRPYQTKYQHLDSFAVHQGDRVRAGDPIGGIGNSGVGINSVHLHFALALDVDTGSFPRKSTVNPMRLLSYTPVPSRLSMERSDTELTLVLEQDRAAVDVVRWELEVPADNPTPLVLDWETRDGMNPDDDDDPSWNGLTVEPDDFTVGAPFYRVTLRWAGDWSDLASAAVTLTDVRGRSERFEQAF